MKKGQEYTGTVEKVRFPNKGRVCVYEEDEIGTCTVSNVIKGQKVRFRVTKKRNGACEGCVLEVVERSGDETESACPHSSVCGGCAYQTLPYDRQLLLKEEQVHDLLEPVIAARSDMIESTEKVDIKSLFEKIAPSPVQFGYRNKMEFSFGDACRGGELELGLHKRGSFYDIVTVGGCVIVDEDYRMILKETLAYFRGKETPYFHKRTHEGFLRYLMVRKAARTGEILIDLVTTSAMPKDTPCTEVSLLADWTEAMLALKLSGKIAGILHTVDDSVADAIKNENTEILYGRDFFHDEVLSLSFKITPFSFFQTNTLSAEVLYSKVREYADIAFAASENSGEGKDRPKVIFDLYSGTGTIGQIMSTNADKVIGIEIVEEAVKAANENAESNSLHNCKFLAGDVIAVLDEVSDKPDLIILDPPRDGINPKALAKIADFGVKNIIYVSCKPTSLARDLEYLMGRCYAPVKICPIDQFPGTVHVETVVLLCDKKVDRHIDIDLDVEKLDKTGGSLTVLVGLSV
ncbi:MAG: 23S rRNA (uracil(1939)-C(5))-methyltransferase RlmD [Lachnospiraceae bacterium]|nr:23S rRNA (uracil(1939)-C(5))-methyltransferase RlmD [Lachnospiraceae bacterium]